MLKFIKNPSKIVKNDAQERSGGDLGKGSVPGQLQEQARDDFWSLLAPLGRFWAPFGAQLGAKGLPKSSFWAPSRTKISKNEVQNEASKHI